MDFKIVWSKTAVADLRDLVRYIAEDDRVVAERFGRLIISKMEAAMKFPRMGRMVPEFREDRLREIIVAPCRVVYEIDDELLTLTVLRVWHGARGSVRFNP